MGKLGGEASVGKNVTSKTAGPSAKEAKALAEANTSLKGFDTRIRAAQKRADRALRGLKETVARLA